MNREIKFRAWDETTKRMFTVKSISFTSPHDIKFFETIENQDGAVWADLELMQFTGLLDKNGKEIYEEDIIESSDKTARYRVTFEYGEFTSISLDKEISNEKDGYFYSDIYPSWKVIGNIYENLEIIKDK